MGIMRLWCRARAARISRARDAPLNHTDPMAHAAPAPDPHHAYVLLPRHGAEWEDAVIFLNLENALHAAAQTRWRVEVFARQPDGGMIPTYLFYVDGVLYDGNTSHARPMQALPAAPGVAPRE